MSKYVCLECNQEFEAKHKTALCPKCKSTPLVCVICHKEFPKKYFPYNQKTCSAKCRGIYKQQSGISKAGAVKMQATKFEKYGTLDSAEIGKKLLGELPPKICPLCNKEFIPNTYRQVYCNDKHYGKCPICGKDVEIKDYSIGPQACSEECRMQRIYATNIERYGNKDSVNSEYAKALAKEHNLEQYGKEYYTQTDEFKERFKQTSIERYGTEHPMQNKELQEKAKQTLLERYGVENYAQTDEYKERHKQIMEERYGGIGFGSTELRKQIINTTKEKYGVEWAIQNEGIKEKARLAFRERYGVDNYMQSKDHLSETIKDPSKIDEYWAFKEDPVKYVNSHYAVKPGIYTLAKDLGVSDTPIYDILIKNNCKDLIDRTKMSSIENEMYQFLRTIVNEKDIILNDRTCIAPLELDFYLPKYNFAIECNPTTTHNSTRNDLGDDDPKPYNYHYNKSMKALEQGVFLMHIFGYDWEHKREIMKSMIRNILGKVNYRIYGRNTHVMEVNYQAAKRFLDENHRQGDVVSKYRYGLITNDTNELVSLMTFGKTRLSMGREDSDTENTFELIRFCNKLNTIVVGGASKLFKYFIEINKPDKIISFSDVAHTKGTLYEKLGFTKVSQSDPGYGWVKPYGEVFRSRVSCQKHNLIKMFDDVEEKDIQSKSERQIMIEHGYVQVYDSGVIRWEWTC